MTDEERARRWAETRAESERLLSCDFSKPPPPDEQPTPAYEPPPEDPVSKWRREADEQERRFEAARAARRKQEREEAAQADWSAIEARIAAIERRVATLEEVALASVEFSNNALQAVDRLEQLSTQLSTKLTELRALDDQHRVIDMPSPLRPCSVN